MADVDTALKQQILDVPPAQWKADIHHYRQAYHLGRGVKVADRDIRFTHPPDLSRPQPAGNFTLTTPEDRPPLTVKANCHRQRGIQRRL